MIKKEDMDHQEIIHHDLKIKALINETLDSGEISTETALMKYCKHYDLDWGEWEQLRIDSVAFYFKEFPW